MACAVATPARPYTATTRFRSATTPNRLDAPRGWSACEGLAYSCLPPACKAAPRLARARQPATGKPRRLRARPVLNVSGAGIGDTMQLGRRRPARSAMHHSCHATPVAQAAPVCDKLQKFIWFAQKTKIIEKHQTRCGCFVRNNCPTVHEPYSNTHWASRTSNRSIGAILLMVWGL